VVGLDVWAEGQTYLEATATATADADSLREWQTRRTRATATADAATEADSLGDGKRKARARTTAKAKNQYGDLSTAAAKCAASGRDDSVWGEVWESNGRRRFPSGMETRRAKATADSCGMENKRSKSNGKSKKPIQGSLHCGGKVQGPSASLRIEMTAFGVRWKSYGKGRFASGMETGIAWDGSG